MMGGPSPPRQAHRENARPCKAFRLMPRGGVVAEAEHALGAQGGQVRTCDGGSIRLNAAEKRPLAAQRGPQTTGAGVHVREPHSHAGRIKGFGYIPECYRYWEVGGCIA